MLLGEVGPEAGGQGGVGIDQLHAGFTRFEDRQAAAGCQIKAEGGAEVADHQREDVAEHIAHLAALAGEGAGEAGGIEIDRALDRQIVGGR